MNKRDIRYRIKLLKRIKKTTPIKTQARRDINKQIRELKKKLKGTSEPISKEKKELIAEILKRKPEYKDIRLDLEGYTLEQLTKHLARIRRV